MARLRTQRLRAQVIKGLKAVWRPGRRWLLVGAAAALAALVAVTIVVAPRENIIPSVAPRQSAFVEERCATVLPRVNDLATPNGQGYLIPEDLNAPAGIYDSAWRVAVADTVGLKSVTHDEENLKARFLQAMREPDDVETDLGTKGLDLVATAAIGLGQLELTKRDRSDGVAFLKRFRTKTGYRLSVDDPVTPYATYVAAQGLSALGEQDLDLAENLRKSLREMPKDATYDELDSKVLPVTDSFLLLGGNPVSIPNLPQRLVNWQRTVLAEQPDGLNLALAASVESIASQAGLAVPRWGHHFRPLQVDGGIALDRHGAVNQKATFYGAQIGLIHAADVKSYLPIGRGKAGWLSYLQEPDLASTYDAVMLHKLCNRPSPNVTSIVSKTAQRFEAGDNTSLVDVGRLCGISRTEDLSSRIRSDIESAIKTLASGTLTLNEASTLKAAATSCKVKIDARSLSVGVPESPSGLDFFELRYLNNSKYWISPTFPMRTAPKATDSEILLEVAMSTWGHQSLSKKIEDLARFECQGISCAAKERQGPDSAPPTLESQVIALAMATSDDELSGSIFILK